MEDFVSKIKKGAKKAFGEAEKFTSAAVTKTGNAVNQTKMNYAINGNEDKIKNILSEIGAIVYEEYKSGCEFPENIDVKLKAVENLYDEIAELKAKIAEMNKTVVCPKCGNYIASDSVFCANCGFKI